MIKQFFEKTDHILTQPELKSIITIPSITPEFLNHLIQCLFSSSQRFVSACFSELAQLFEKAGSSVEHFSILKYLYPISVQKDKPFIDNRLLEIVESVLWKTLFQPSSPKIRSLASDLLLSVLSSYNSIDLLSSYVEKSCLLLLKEENPNCCIFIEECIQSSLKFLDPYNYGFVPHQYFPSDSKIEILYSDSDKISTHSFFSVLNLKSSISQLIHKDPHSFTLFEGSKKLQDSDLLKSITSHIVEVRDLYDYDPTPAIEPKEHFFSLFQNERFASRFLALLKSPIASNVYPILLKVPTLNCFCFS